MSEELKIKIPVLVDDSDAAKANFKTSIETLAGQFKGDKAPKIEITVSKVNATKAIAEFKRQIEEVISSVEASPKTNINVSLNKQKATNIMSADSQIADINRVEQATVTANKKMEEAESKRIKKSAEAAAANATNGTTAREIANAETKISKYKTLGENIDDVNSAFSNLIAKKTALDGTLDSGTEDVKGISAAYSEYQAALIQTNNILRTMGPENTNKRAIEKDQAALHNLILEMQAYEKANDRLHENRQYSTQFDSLKMRAQTAFDAKDFAQVRQLNGEMRTLRQRISDARLEGQKFGTKLGQQFDKLGVYLSASAVIMKLGQAIKATVTTVFELDSVVADLQIATGGTRKETQELLKTYSAMGKELGATTVDVGKAADAWLRQGYSVAQTNELIKNSMMLSKLGQIDSAEATKALTSAMKGYQISVEGSAGVVDKFTAVDMSAAVSAGYLATAMAETATSARLAGVDMNTLIGYIASIGEVTQDGAESVGNFMKTLFARMGNVKSGNLIDPETAENLGDVEATLAGLGVKLRTSKGEFRNFGEVLNEVAGDWSSYGSVQQRALAVAFSGTRQSEKFLTLMENFGTATDYATIATNSAGTALDKYENSYLKSAEAAQSRFTAQFEQMSNTIWNSDFFIGAIDVGTGALGFFTQMVETLDVIPPLISVVAGALSALKGKGISQLIDDPSSLSGKKMTFGFNSSNLSASDIEAFTRMSEAMKLNKDHATVLAVEYDKLSQTGKALGNDVVKTAGSFSVAAQSVNKTSIASKAAAVAIKALSVAMNMIIWFVIAAAIQAVVTAISDYINRAEKAAEVANELRSQYDELVSSIQSMKDELKEVSARITELQEKGSLSLVEQAELQRLKETNTELERKLRIEEQLASHKKKEAEKATEEALAARTKSQSYIEFQDDGSKLVSSDSYKSRSIFEQVNLQMDLIKKFEQDKKRLESILVKAEVGSEQYTESKKIYEVNEDYLSKLKADLDDNIRFLIDSESGLNKASESYRLTMETLTSYDKWSGVDFTAKFDTIYDSAQFANVRKEIERLAKTSPITGETLSNFSVFITELGKVGISAEQAASHINSISKTVNNITIDPTIDNIIDGIAAAEDAFNSLGDILKESLDPDTDVSNNSLVALKEQFGSLGDTYEDAIAVISNSKSSYDDVKQAVDSLATAYLSSATFMKQVNAGNKEAMVLGLKNIGVTNAEEVAERALSDAKINDAIATEIASEQTGALAASTEDLILKLYGVAKGSEEAARMLALWNIKKQIASNGTLAKYLAADSSGFLALANAAGIASVAVSEYSRISAKIANLQSIVINGGPQAGIGQALAGLYAERAALTDGVQASIDDATSKSYYVNIGVPSSSGGKGGGAKQAVEEYKAAIDALYESEERLAKLQKERSILQHKVELTEDLDEKIAYLDQISQYYKDEQAQLHAINNMRDDMIQKNVDELSGQGFEVAYDPESNNLLIENMEQINKLTANGKEETNALRKKYEEMIQSTLAMNDANEEGSNQYYELAKSIQETVKQMQSLDHQKYTDKVNVRENKLSLLGEQYDQADKNIDSSKAFANLELQKQELISIQKESAAEAADLRADIRGGNEDLIQGCVDKWWEAQKELEAINKKIVDTILDSYDNFISEADDFELWTNMDTTKVDWLEKKLEEINKLYEEQLITEREHKKLVQETAKAIYDEKAEAINNIIDLTMELIKQEKENLIEHLEQEKDDYAEIVKLKKESLALTKEENGYQKTLAEKLAEIAKIQNKLNELAPDDSRESVVEQKQLKEELAKLQSDLDDAQADHAYDSQVDALDKSQEAFEKSKDEEIEKIKESIDTTQELYAEAIKRINEDWDTLYDNLIAYNMEYGDGIRGEDSITSAWEIAKDAVDEYGGSLNDILATLERIKTENITPTDVDSVGRPSKPDNSGSGNNIGETQNQINEIISRMKQRSNQWHADPKAQEDLAAANDADAQRLSKLENRAVMRDKEGWWHYDSVEGPRVYHTGGVAGDHPTLKQNEVLAVLEKGEPVLDRKKEQGLFKLIDFATFMTEKLGATLADGAGAPTITAPTASGFNAVKGIAVPNQTVSNQFSPTIVVQISGVGEKLDANKLGNMVAKTAMEKLKNAFNQSGFGNSRTPLFGN